MNERPPFRFRCPRCGGGAYGRWGPLHPLMLHWILNPGLAVNEIFLGQRQPRTLYFCRSCPGWIWGRTFVWCPHCDQFHDAKIWSGGMAFFHWLGLICPDCGGRIASMWNVTSILLLGLTHHCWWFILWPVKSRYLLWEQLRALRSRERLEARPPEPPSATAPPDA